MKLLVPVPTVLETVPVATAFHERIFHLVFSLVPFLEPSSNVVVLHCISEVVKCKVVDFLVVAVGEFDVFWLHHVVKQTMMASSGNLDTISHEMPIKLHQQTNKSDIVRRNKAFEMFVVFISEGWVVTWLE